MKIGFIGSPCSGKTTIAAMLFSEVKQNGLVAELLTEEARRYISFFRYKNRVNPSLDYQDQLTILKDQAYSENAFHFNNENSILITDSSWINALAYMNEEQYKNSISILNTFDVTPYDVLFHSFPIAYSDNDLNRLHSYNQSKEVDSKFIHIVEDLTKMNLIRVNPTILNENNVKARFNTAYQTMLASLFV